MNDVEVIDINIKNIKNKYDIYLNKQINKQMNRQINRQINKQMNRQMNKQINNINTYEGRNIITKDKIIIDVYSLDILCFAKILINKIIKIDHDNIINIIDIIIDNTNVYIIKKFYENKIKNLEFNINYINQIINGVKYLFDKNIYIYPLELNDIYIDNNIVRISPIFIESKPDKKILYGSPLFSPPHIIQNLKNERETILVKNICILFINLFYNKNFSMDDDFNIILNDIFDESQYYKYLSDILLEKYNISLQNLYYCFSENKKNKSTKKNMFKILTDEVFLMDL